MAGSPGPSPHTGPRVLARRLECLQRIVSKLQMEAGLCEEQLNQADALLQSVRGGWSAGRSGRAQPGHAHPDHAPIPAGLAHPSRPRPHPQPATPPPQLLPPGVWPGLTAGSWAPGRMQKRPAPGLAAWRGPGGRGPEPGLGGESRGTARTGVRVSVTPLQDIRLLAAGKTAQRAGELERDLDKADGMIRLLFNDVQALKDGRHPQGEQMYRRWAVPRPGEGASGPPGPGSPPPLPPPGCTACTSAWWPSAPSITSG